MRHVRKAVLEQLGRRHRQHDDCDSRRGPAETSAQEPHSQDRQESHHNRPDVDRPQRAFPDRLHRRGRVAAYVAEETEVETEAGGGVKRDEIRQRESECTPGRENQQSLRTLQRRLAKTTGSASASATNA